MSISGDGRGSLADERRRVGHRPDNGDWPAQRLFHRRNRHPSGDRQDSIDTHNPEGSGRGRNNVGFCRENRTAGRDGFRCSSDAMTVLELAPPRLNRFDHCDRCCVRAVGQQAPEKRFAHLAAADNH